MRELLQGLSRRVWEVVRERRSLVPSRYVAGEALGAFSISRIITGQMDAYVDIGNRVMRDHPETEADFRRVGHGSILHLFPYDIAASVYPARRAGVTIAASTTPWYLSEDTAAPLRGDGGGDLFFARLDHLVDVVFLRGYGVETAPAPAGCLASMHIARFLRRFSLLAGALDSEVVVADAIVVNGRHCRSPRQLVERLLADPPPALARMEPARLMFPAHGDANTRNILFVQGGAALACPSSSSS